MAENKFVVNTLWVNDNSIINTSEFVTKKEAEEFRDLTMYAMKLNYGENQELVQVIIEEP